MRIQIIILSILLSGCVEQQWINSNYDPSVLGDQYVLDRGNCNRDALASYPQVEVITLPERKEGESGRYRSASDIWASKMSQQAKTQADADRKQYFNSCMSRLGWRLVRTN